MKVKISVIIFLSILIACIANAFPPTPPTTNTTGNSATATALAANGANCNAGYAPLGVDASGAVESCTQYQAYDADLTTWAGVTPGSNVTTLIATPSSANLATAITDETGSGVLVFGTSPTLTTPNIVRPTPITHAATEASGASLYGHTHLVTGAYTVTLPAVSVGMHGRFYATTAALYSVDCNAADHFVLAGVALTNGNKVSSDGSVGAFFEWECTAANTITILFSNVNFVDGGA